MRRLLSFSDYLNIAVGAGTGQETTSGYITLPLEGRYLIETVSVFAVTENPFGKRKYTGCIVYWDGVTYRWYDQGFSGHFLLYPEDGSFDFYEQNEFSGTGFTNFAKTKKVLGDLNTINEYNIIFSGQKIGIDVNFIYNLVMAGVLTAPEMIWETHFYYNMVINDQIPDYTKAIKTLKSIRRQERFDFTPGGSSLKFQKK